MAGPWTLAWTWYGHCMKIARPWNDGGMAAWPLTGMRLSWTWHGTWNQTLEPDLACHDVTWETYTWMACVTWQSLLVHVARLWQLLQIRQGLLDHFRQMLRAWRHGRPFREPWIGGRSDSRISRLAWAGYSHYRYGISWYAISNDS